MIPSDVQARINTIVARFEPRVVAPAADAAGTVAGVAGGVLGTAPIATTTGTTGTTGTSGAGDFASVYADALDAASQGGAASQAPTGTYENGRLPDSALAPIGVGNHRLTPAAATAFKRMRATALAQGVNIGVTDSYRSYDAQVDVARRKGLYSQGGLAAKPGTSDHGLGLALDLDLDDTAQAWMRANAGRFGFEEDTPREPWHWGFKGTPAASGVI